MKYFCTYFDSHYLGRGLALYESLRRHCRAFRLWVLCMDDECHRRLAALALPGIEPIALADFERGDAELLRVKPNRSRIEYYFTCSPTLPLYVFRIAPEVDLVTYLDADLFFFGDPQPLHDELGDGSVGIIAHRFPPHLRGLEQHGVYNVGWLSFRRDEDGLACIEWWRDRCIEWCHDRCEEGRFADQKYLDCWPELFRGVRVLHHKGANLAPWNLVNYRLEVEGSTVHVDGEPLIFFHFHGLKQVAPGLWNPNLVPFGSWACTVVRRQIYGPYIRALRAAPGSSVSDGIRSPGPQLKTWRQRVDHLRVLMRGAYAGHYFVSVAGHLL